MTFTLAGFKAPREIKTSQCNFFLKIRCLIIIKGITVITGVRNASWLQLQVSSYAEIKHLKEEIAKKGSLLVKLKEDKMKRPGGPGAPKDRSPGPGVKSASSDREKEELRKTIKKLEGRLSSMNAAEKPLEEHQIEQQVQYIHQDSKLLKSIHFKKTVARSSFLSKLW